MPSCILTKMSWLTEILEQHAELETPKSFWYWSALTAVSAIVKDNIWLDKYLYKLYPNIYVMLHADSGVKKGPPVAMAKRLVRKVNNTRIITGRSSIQGILKELGTARTEPGGKIVSQSVAFICSSELTSSIVEDKVATTILTDLYDRQWNEGDWRQLLKMDEFTLRDPLLTMLTATNEAHSSEFFTRKDLHGGYFGRTFVIYEPQSETINSLMFPLKHPPDYDKSAEYLAELAKLKGPLIMHDKDRNFFDDWYHSFRTGIKGQQDKTGALNRFDDSVLKVAMLISLATQPELVITRAALEEATSECEKFLGNIRRTTMSQGKSQWAEQKGKVIHELLGRENHMITRMQLNKKFMMDANVDEWDAIMQSLEAAGVIQLEQHGNQIVYVMPDKQVNYWLNHWKGK